MLFNSNTLSLCALRDLGVLRGAEARRNRAETSDSLDSVGNTATVLHSGIESQPGCSGTYEVFDGAIAMGRGGVVGVDCNYNYEKFAAWTDGLCGPEA